MAGVEVAAATIMRIRFEDKPEFTYAALGK